MTAPLTNQEDEILAQLDPDIRPFVEILRRERVETFESCQGGKGHSSPEPMVRFHGNAYEGYRAFTVAMNYGMPVKELNRHYDVVEGGLVGPYWKLIFKQKAA